MAFYHGKGGAVVLDGGDGAFDGLDDINLPQITSWRIRHGRDTVQGKVMGNDATATDYGHENWDGSITILFDKTSTEHQEVINAVKNGKKLTGQFQTDSADTSSGYWQGTFCVEEYEVTAESEEYIEYEASIIGDGTLTYT